MILWASSAILVASLVQAEMLVVPSGQDITYYDTVQNQPGTSGLTYRFRFIAPSIDRETGSIDFETAAQDMDYLCSTFALSRLPEGGPIPSQIIISLSDRPVEFGTPTPEATQYFEAYRIEDGTCIWEGF